HLRFDVNLTTFIYTVSLHDALPIFFIQWVKQPNENNRHFWEKWLDQHPEKREVVMQAVSIISSVHYQDKPDMEDRLYVEVFENRSEEHTSELQSRENLVCRLLLAKK